MAVKLTWGFTPIELLPGHFRSTSTWNKGMKLVKSSHVRSVTEEVAEKVLTAKCLPQTCVNAREYDIRIQVSVSHKANRT